PGKVLVGYVGNALIYGIAATPLRRFGAAAIGAFVGQFLIGYSSYVYAWGRDRGPISVLTNGLGVGIVAALAAGLSVRQPPARGSRRSVVGLLLGALAGVIAGAVIWLLGSHGQGILTGAVGLVAGAIAGGVLFESRDDDTVAANPHDTLARDRGTFM